MEGALTAAATIRDGRLDDLDALERLENAVFDTDRLSRRSLRRFLLAGTTAVAVADRGGALAGYAMVGFRAGSKLGRLFSLAVDPGAGRLGLGRALLGACEEAARTRGCAAVRLEVRADNAPAVALYRAAGYRQFGALPDYYEDGAAALRFERIVAGADGRDGPPGPTTL